MNVLQILQSAYGELGVSRPTAYNSEYQAAAFFHSVCRELRASRAFPQQKRTATVTLSSGRNKYPLPEDFYGGLLGSQYDRSSSWALIGPISDGQWNYRLYGPGSSGERFSYRVFGPDNLQGSATAGGQIQIDPTPSATSTIGFDYISKNLLLPPPWQASSAVTINHYRHANGKIWFATTGGTTSTTPPSAAGTDGTVVWAEITAPYETMLADADVPLFDDDVLIEGIKFRFQEHKGLDYTESKKRFYSYISNAQARWVGSTIGSMGGPLRDRRYIVQSGGWSFS